METEIRDTKRATEEGNWTKRKQKPKTKKENPKNKNQAQKSKTKTSSVWVLKINSK